MGKPIRIIVRGDGIGGSDAPTVDDLMTQIQDQVYIFQEVEKFITEKNAGQLVWRVTDVSKNSPLAIEITPYPKTDGMSVDNRAQLVVNATARGFKFLEQTGKRPFHFTDSIVKKIQKIATRVTEGLATTKIEFSEYQDSPDINLDRQNAEVLISQLKSIEKAKRIPPRELGSMEGFITKVELDGFGRPIMWLKGRVDGQVVKCISSDDGFEEIERFEVGEVLNGLRVRVHGLIHYKSQFTPSIIYVEKVEVFKQDEYLPDFDEIVDPNFTAGVEAVAYIHRLRDNDTN